MTSSDVLTAGNWRTVVLNASKFGDELLCVDRRQLAYRGT
jgi:hypothetical protein